MLLPSYPSSYTYTHIDNIVHLLYTDAALPLVQPVSREFKMQSDIALTHALSDLNQFDKRKQAFLLRISKELRLPIGTMQLTSQDEPRRSPRPLRTPVPRQTAATDEHPIVPDDFACVHRTPTEPRQMVIPPAARK
jgi:hypothetical protein